MSVIGYDVNTVLSLKYSSSYAFVCPLLDFRLKNFDSDDYDVHCNSHQSSLVIVATVDVASGNNRNCSNETNDNCLIILLKIM